MKEMLFTDSQMAFFVFCFSHQQFTLHWCSSSLSDEQCDTISNSIRRVCRPTSSGNWKTLWLILSLPSRTCANLGFRSDTFVGNGSSFSRLYPSEFIFVSASEKEETYWLSWSKLKLDTVMSSLSKAEPFCFHGNCSIFMGILSSLCAAISHSAHHHADTSV